MLTNIVKAQFRSIVVSCIALLASGARAQLATPEQMGEFAGRKDMHVMHLKTTIGSFKVVNAEGRIEIDFVGTAMVCDLKGQVQSSGQIQKQYDSHGRQVFIGKGKLVVSGKWRAIQWFGKDMNATWFGKGAVRLAGEFDKDGNTGEYWFEDPTYKKVWYPTGIITVSLPDTMSPTPKRRTRNF